MRPRQVIWEEHEHNSPRVEKRNEPNLVILTAEILNGFCRESQPGSVEVINYGVESQQQTMNNNVVQVINGQADTRHQIANNNIEVVVIDDEVETQHQSTYDEIEVIDDEVAIISTRMFNEAMNNSQRNLHAYVGQNVNGEIDLELRLGRSDGSSSSERRPAPSLELSLAIGQPKTWAFVCGICNGELKEETAAKCGHIFCKECIEAAFAVKKECPICKKRFRGHNITTRIYLPKCE